MNESSSVRSGSGKGHEKRHCKSEFRKNDAPTPRFTNPQGILVRHDQSQEESKTF